MAETAQNDTKDITIVSPKARKTASLLGIAGEGVGLLGALYLGYLANLGAISIPVAIVGAAASGLGGTFAGMVAGHAVEKNAEITVKMREQDVPLGVGYTVNEPEISAQKTASLFTEKLRTQGQSLEPEGHVR